MTTQTLKLKSKYVRIRIPAYFEFFDFEKHYTEDNFPCRKEIDDTIDSFWEITVNLKSHQVLEWEKDFGGLNLSAKVTDNGIYTLLDKDKNDIWCIKGYAPNSFIPEKDGFGDYINLYINEDGIVENWYDDPDFADFIEYGFPTAAITSEGNIQNFIEHFVRPFARRLETDLKASNSTPFRFYQTQIGLSENPKGLDNAVWIHSQSKYDFNKDIVKKHLPKTKSVRIDFSATVKWDDPLAYFNLFTDIQLQKSTFRIIALKKIVKYTDLPVKQVQDELYNLFKQYYIEAFGDNSFQMYLE